MLSFFVTIFALPNWIIMSIQELKNKNVVLYILNKAPEKTVDRLKLIKLIWLADRWHLNQYGRKITKADYYALPFGPVASQVLDLLKRNEDCIKKIGNNQVALAQADEKYLSQTDRDILNKVWDEMNKLGQLELVDFSHNFPEWKRYETYLKDSSMPNSYRMVEEDFFEKNDFMNVVDDETRESSKEEYLRSKHFNSYLANL